MQKFTSFLLFTIFSLSLVAEEGGFCRKCEVLREYHKSHPSKYTFYEDYLKDVEENGPEAVTPAEDDLPPDVNFIMNLEKVGAETDKE